MTLSFDDRLSRYADLAVRVGLDLQPGQRLVVRAPTDTAPLVRHVAERAYAAGASLVDVMWSDDGVTLARLRHAATDTLDRVPEWRAAGLERLAGEGGAALYVAGSDPDLLAGQDAERVAAVQRATARSLRPFDDARNRQEVNWCIVGAAREGWARRVFPDLAVDEAVRRLWHAIFATVRIGDEGDDPVAVWRAHLASLERAREHLDLRGFRALRLRAPAADGATGPDHPATDLEVGLPDGHRWLTAGFETRGGIRYVANLPTEEVFTTPHRDRVDGVVVASKPLNYGGRLVRDFGFRFEGGRVVEHWAAEGQDALDTLLATDEGARRLGEIALVPHGSPIARSGLLFYDTLYDENAACHLALGRGFPFAIEGWRDRAVGEAEGVNPSLLHVDFMFGSARLDVDGVAADGSVEPVMRAGDWAFGTDA